MLPLKTYLQHVNSQTNCIFFDSDSNSLKKLTHPNKTTIYKKEHAKELQVFLSSIEIENYNPHLIIHLFYEYSYILLNLEHLIDSNTILAIIIEFSQSTILPVLSNPTHLDFQPTIRPEQFSLLQPSDYEKIFNIGKEKLQTGQFYQFNLTASLTYTKKNQSNLHFSSHYHSTFFDDWKTSFICNTPEILFEIENRKLSTKPIKGTATTIDDLLSGDKNIIELRMITDLLRNDLNKLTPYKCKVESINQILQVPGLYHLYSHLSVPLITKDLYSIIHALFPGGSITGCPKKKCVEILSTLEKNTHYPYIGRGFYTGTSIFKKGNKLIGTINIRSIEENSETKMLRVCAGGGITLRSNAQSEYNEMMDKMLSTLIGLGFASEHKKK